MISQHQQAYFQFSKFPGGDLLEHRLMTGQPTHSCPIITEQGKPGLELICHHIKTPYLLVNLLFALRHPIGQQDTNSVALQWSRLKHPTHKSSAAEWGRVTSAAGGLLPRRDRQLSRAGCAHRRRVRGADGSLHWCLPGGEKHCHIMCSQGV